MGIFHSKIAPIDKRLEQLNNFDDPRSPTVNINRSPIGTETVPDKPIITKVRDLTADLTEILDNAQTPDRFGGGAEKFQSAMDPRSPGMFLRTPLVLDESGASNISLRGSSIEYEEIDCDGELSFKDCTATDISETLGVDSGVGGTGSIFSNDTSLNTELKADIDSIIQKLYDAGSIKDPRSPSVDIQRTPIVFQEEREPSSSEEQAEDQTKEETIVEQPQPPLAQQDDEPKAKEEKPITITTKLTIVHQDEDTITTTPSLIITPKRNPKSELSARKTGGGGPRTPLGCVTNMQPLTNSGATGNGGNDVLRKAALIGQLKQNVAAAGGLVATSAEIAPAAKKLQTRSKIPTFRMK